MGIRYTATGIGKASFYIADLLDDKKYIIHKNGPKVPPKPSSNEEYEFDDLKDKKEEKKDKKEDKKSRKNISLYENDDNINIDVFTANQ